MVKILFVDDDHTTLDLMKHVAQICGYLALVCSSGLKALDMAIKEKPDLIMVDLNLQDIHGTTFINKLRKKRKIASTPVVILTAEKIFDNEVDEKISGADGYIQKPLRINDLPEAVKTYIKV